MLIFAGERLSDEEVDHIFKDCMDEEDEDGMIPYAREYPSDGVSFPHIPFCRILNTTILLL